MKYLKFKISNYRAIEGELVIDISKKTLVPIVGINECGKTTILQAIYCFDETNDNEYSGKHLSDIKNLYRTSEKEDSIITAIIEIKYSELIEEYALVLVDEEKRLAEDSNESIDKDEDSEKKALTKLPKIFPLLKNAHSGSITIQRNLNTKKYDILELKEFSDFDDEFRHKFSTSVVLSLPYILYNDDFMDRPPTTVPIPDKKPATLSGWLAIYERLFYTSSNNYSLFDLIKEKDSRRSSSILSDVEETVNKTLSKAWKTFLLSNHSNLEVSLTLIPFIDPEKKCSNQLQIKIIENIGGKTKRSFDVVDRSKGFLWFFNFVMKLEFNHKISGKKDTIYLLDEPGSYLHYSAQEKLCNKLVDISQKHGNVIYCTHSHTLLNPDLIPLNSIYIVEKDNQKRIKATPLSLVKTKFEDSTAYQPILEALQISALNFIKPDNSIIAVEGIYDKYSIELFTNLTFKLALLPGASANSIIKNIQFLNAFNCNYVAIWDNDKEGREKYEKACKFYGEFESKKFDKLPLKGLENRRMENMFEDNDIKKMAIELGLDEKANYEKVISSLYFSEQETKKKLIKLVAVETKNNFKILDDIISKRMNMKDE